MAVTTSWTIKLEQYGSSIDLTSRTVGAVTTTTVEVGRFGSSNAIVSIRNDDGEFTPDGSGTYGSTDFFQWALTIRATVDDGTTQTVCDVFAGIVNDVAIDDNGVNSEIRFTAVDFFTSAGTQIVEADLSLDTSVYNFQSVDAVMGSIYNGVYEFDPGPPPALIALIPPVIFPGLGRETGAQFKSHDQPITFTTPFTMFEIDDWFNVSVADLINTGIMPAGPCVGWPGGLDFSGGTFNNAVAHVLDFALVNHTTYRVAFTFDESPTGSGLPLRRVQRGYTNDSIVNSAQTQSNSAGSTAYYYRNTASALDYGQRNVVFSTLANAWDDFWAINPVIRPDAYQGDVRGAGERWANRTSTSRFSVKQFQITAKMVEAIADTAAAAKWAALLDVETGIWNPATITFTPTNNSQVDELVVLGSRTINLTPTDATVTIDCVPLADNSSFLLDDSTFGVLDRNRLG